MQVLQLLGTSACMAQYYQFNLKGIVAMRLPASIDVISDFDEDRLTCC